jgi:hypothetical protein
LEKVNQNGVEIFTIDYGKVNLKSLALTNDVKLYERLKAQGNIGVLFEPKVISDVPNINLNGFYLVGILEDK